MKLLSNIWLVIKWATHNIWWMLTPEPKDIKDYVNKATKCVWPFYKFEPMVFRNNYGNMWQIYLSNDGQYTRRMTLTINADIEFSENGKVTAIDLFDEELKKIEIHNSMERFDDSHP